MNILRKIISAFLGITILVCSVPLTTIISSAASSEENEQVALSDEYIYYTDLFYAYSYYLANDAYFENYSNDIENIYDSVYSAYKNSPLVVDTGIDFALDTITSPTDMVKLITDSLGLTDFSYNDALDAANEALVGNLLTDSTFSDLEDAYGKVGSMNKKLNTLVGYFNKLELESDDGYIDYTAEYYVQEAFDYLHDAGCLSFISDQTLANLWTEINASDFKLSDCFELASTEIEIAKAMVTAIMMEDSRLEIVDSIIATQETDTILKQGMTRLKSQLQGNFITYFIKNYLVNKIADELFEKVDKLVVDAILGKELTAILGVVKKVFNHVVDAPTYDEALKLQVLICYSKDLANAIPTFAESFSQGPFLSDKIAEYENIFVVYDAINKAAMGLSTSIAGMLDPYAKAYEIMREAAENGIESVTIKTGLLEIPISSAMSDEELYAILTMRTTLVYSGNPVTLASKIVISNGISTATIEINSNLLYSALSFGLSDNQALIMNFEDKYGETSLYCKHIESAKNTVLECPPEERMVLSKDVYSEWTYDISANTRLKLQSDAIERGCIYAVKNTFCGNMNIRAGSFVTIPTNEVITIDGNVCMMGYSLGDHPGSSLRVEGELMINGVLSNIEMNGYIENNGILKVDEINLPYSHWTFTNNGSLQVDGDVSLYRTYFIQENEDAEFIIKGDFSIEAQKYNSITNGTVVLSGDEIQSVTMLSAYNLIIDNENGVKYLSDINVYGLYNSNGNPIDNNGYSTKMYNGATFIQGYDYGKIYVAEDLELKSSVKGDFTIPSETTLTIPADEAITIDGDVCMLGSSSVNSIRVDGELVINGVLSNCAQRGYVENNGKLKASEISFIDSFWTFTNNGSLQVDGDVSLYRSTFVQDCDDTEFVIKGNFSIDALIYSAITSGMVTLSGEEMQSVTNLNAPVMIIENESVEGVVFNSSISPSILFNHNGNNFTLYNNGSGSIFVDYDGDGMKDNVDPEPTVGNPCTITVISEDETKGSVSVGEIQTIGGTEVTIKAEPTYKYEFSKWVNSAGTTVSTSAEYTFVARGDETLTAVFVKRSQSISVDCVGGTIEAPTSAEIESTVNVSVIEEDGYVYTEGSLKYNDIVIDGNSFVMPDEPVILTAEFVRNDYYFALQEMLDEAKAYTYETYSKESFAELTAAMENAEVALTNGISQEDSDRHIANLQSAIDSLEERYVVSITVDETPVIYVGGVGSIYDTIITVEYDNGITITPSDYLVDGFNGDVYGEQTISITYDGFSVEHTVTVNKRLISDCLIEEIEDQLYDNSVSEYTPNTTIQYTLTNENLVIDQDYVVEYSDNTYTGTATAVISGINNYEGTQTVTFEIYCEHNYEVETYTEPTASSNGYSREVCSICGDVVEKELVLYRFAGATLTLHDSLAMNYYVSSDYFTDYGYVAPYVSFEMNGIETIVSDYTVSGEYYVFTLNDILPNQMNDTVTATLYATFYDREISSEPWEYSISEYLYTLLEDCSAEENTALGTLVVDLLNYGAASQVYTGYNTDNLVNSALTDEQIALGTSTAPELATVLNAEYETVDNATVTWKSVGLNLEESFTIRVKLAADSIDNLTVVARGFFGEKTIDSSDFVATNGGYYVFFDGINATQMSEPIYLTVYEGETAVSNTLCYSVESYAYSKQNSTDENLVALVNAMMNYGNSAVVYDKKSKYNTVRFVFDAEEVDVKYVSIWGEHVSIGSNSEVVSWGNYAVDIDGNNSVLIYTPKKYVVTIGVSFKDAEWGNVLYSWTGNVEADMTIDFSNQVATE